MTITLNIMRLSQFTVLFIYLLSQSRTQALPTPANLSVTELSRRSTPYSGQVSGNKPNTFYRAVYGTELTDLERLFKTVPNPRSLNPKRGDFNIEGTGGMYLWNNYKNADAWCMIKKKQGYKNCRIAQFSWNPPRNLKIKRFERADEEWDTFVWWNWDRNNQRRGNKHTIQRTNDWIEGPMSETLPNGKFGADTTVGMQYAIVNGDLLEHLRFERWHDVTPVHDEFKKVKKEASPAQAAPKKESQGGKKKTKRAVSSSGTHNPQRHPSISKRSQKKSLPGVQTLDALIMALMKSTLAQAESKMAAPDPAPARSTVTVTSLPTGSGHTPLPLSALPTFTLVPPR